MQITHTRAVQIPTHFNGALVIGIYQGNNDVRSQIESVAWNSDMNAIVQQPGREVQR